MFHACFIPIATCFASTLYHFYTFFGTNLLTRCRSASSCFLLFLYSRKASLEIFSELDETTRGCLFFQNTPDGAKEQQRRATRAPHATRARFPPLPRPRVVWAPRGSPVAALSPTYSPRRENPKYLSTAVVNPSSGGFRTSSRHPAGEGNRHRRLLHRHACLRSDA